NDFDAVVFEDYAKGFLTQPMVDQIISDAKKTEKIVAVDPNPLHAINWHDVTLVKPNRKEAFQAAGIVLPRISYYPDQDPNLLAAGQALIDKWRTQYVLISLAEQGMMLFRRDETPHH